MYYIIFFKVITLKILLVKYKEMATRDPLKPLKDQAARDAIITSGIVGLTTAIMVKGLDIDIGISLPIGVATAVSLDYLINYRPS